jgi:hypothetical protein
MGFLDRVWERQLWQKQGEFRSAAGNVGDGGQPRAISSDCPTQRHFDGHFPQHPQGTAATMRI